MVKPIIEVCANSAESCVEAQKGGAYRVELCAGIPEGGTTPSIGEIKVAREFTNLKINVIIRPRGGDFLYSPLEIKTMKYDINAAKNAGADGVVFGCLDCNGDIDMAMCKELMECSTGMSTTFHRAFDVCRDPFIALEQIISLGFDRILTSGQKSDATQGAQLIAKLIQLSSGRIIIMPGCGVNETNIALLKDKTGANEFHMSARKSIDSKMIYRNEEVSMGGTVCISEFSREVTSAERVANSIQKL
ncbi:MAG: copper homeostasis protein CutC [Mucinivorans sp.]